MIIVLASNFIRQRAIDERDSETAGWVRRSRNSAICQACVCHGLSEGGQHFQEHEVREHGLAGKAVLFFQLVSDLGSH